MTGNHFMFNENVDVSGKVSSLADFVERASGFRGITSLGNYDSLNADSVRMLPLIFSNLGLSFLMRHNTVDSNPVSAGYFMGVTECATTA